MRGAHLIAKAQALNYLGLTEGVPLDRPALEAAVARWNESDLLGTVSYTVEPVDEGRVEVVLACSERVKPTVVTFQGNERFSAKRLRKLIQVEPGQPITALRARQIEEQIAVAHRQAGFPLVQVRAQLSSLTETDRKLVFYVSEGPRTWVERIVFEGSRSVPQKKLRSAMQSKTRWRPSWLRKGWFRREMFQNDIKAVEATYYAMGYLDARVGGYVSYSDDLRRSTLHLVVYEGELYRVKALSFEGNTIYRRDELLAEIPLMLGEAFRPADFEKAKERVSELYANQGYMDVTERKGNLKADYDYGEEGAEVSVLFRITEGEPVFIRRIEIRGLTKTREPIVRRTLSFYPGERASRLKFEESERLLLNTGYFEFDQPQSVRITLEPDEGALRDAIVQVEEGQTGRFMIGGGIGSDAGVMGQISLVEENFDISNWPTSWNDLWRGNAFRGGGQRLTLLLEAGSKRSYYSIGLFDPAVGDSDYSVGGNIYSMASAYEYFDETRTGLSVTMGRRLTRDVSRSFTVGYESIDIDDVDKDSAYEIRRDDGSHAKPFVRFRTGIDKRDSRFTPTEGYAAGAEVEVAAADVETVKLVLDAEKHWTVREHRDKRRDAVALRGRAGMVTSYGDRVPVFERFYAGGIRTLRGFDYRGVSPVDRATGDRIGGESMLVGSVEYSTPVSTQQHLRLVTFVDAGYVQQDVEDVLSGWDELRASVGTGIRWRIPALGSAVLEIDLAFPIMKESGDETQNFHFSIGASRRF